MRRPCSSATADFHIFASARLFITIYKEICHLTILLVRWSCQYVSARQKYQNDPSVLKLITDRRTALVRLFIKKYGI